jgi:SWI/SNF-related matrix-associated actin-dependent regulator of chromatin subfamily A3
VGIRYYAGTAHPGEYVQLIREPSNVYDKNAIRVDNMAGIKVGHIKATVAVALAPVMDTLKQVKVDGTIPKTGNAYVLPIKIEMFGESADDQARIAAIFRRYHHSWTLNRNLNDDESSDQAPVAVKVETKTMDWKTAQQSLDDMFEKISKEQMMNLPDLSFPAALTAKLFDHQKQGIRWLYQRETDTRKEAPFYKKVKEKGKTVWLSEITNSSQPDPPAAVKGSIL